METTDANYTYSWKMLEDTKADENSIVARHGELLVQTRPLEIEHAGNLLAFARHVQQHLRCLTSLKVPVDTWDVLLLALQRPKLPTKTWRKFDSTCGEKQRPTTDGLMRFLTQRARTLRTERSSDDCHSVGTSPQKTSNETRQKPQILNRTSNESKSVFVTTTSNCVVCNDSTHSIYRCERFLDDPVRDKVQTIRKRNLCLNCLKPGHIAHECRSSRCRICDAMNHTLLHQDRSPRRSPRRSPGRTNERTSPPPRVRTSKSSERPQKAK